MLTDLVLANIHEVLGLSKLVDGLKDEVRIALELARARLKVLEQGRLTTIAVEDGALDGLGSRRRAGGR